MDDLFEKEYACFFVGLRFEKIVCLEFMMSVKRRIVVYQ